MLDRGVIRSSVDAYAQETVFGSDVLNRYLASGLLLFSRFGAPTPCQQLFAVTYAAELDAGIRYYPKLPPKMWSPFAIINIPSLFKTSGEARRWMNRFPFPTYYADSHRDSQDLKVIALDPFSGRLALTFLIYLKLSGRWRLLATDLRGVDLVKPLNGHFHV